MRHNSTALSRPARFVLGALIVLLGGITTRADLQDRREFTVTAFKYGYAVSGVTTPEIKVTEGDLVKITFEARDIAHSFNIDAYRIKRRAEPGKPAVVIEFRADKKGDFPFYCDLPIDEKCLKETRGTLHVLPKK